MKLWLAKRKGESLLPFFFFRLLVNLLLAYCDYIV